MSYENTVDTLLDAIDRIAHLSQLRQPGPVDLGVDDNEQSQDVLFAELRALENLLDTVVVTVDEAFAVMRH